MLKVKNILVAVYLFSVGPQIVAQVTITSKIFAANSQIFENKPTTVKKLFIIKDTETLIYANNSQQSTIENAGESDYKCIPPVGYETIKFGTSQTKNIKVCFYTDLKLYNQMIQEQSMSSAVSFDVTTTGNGHNGFKVLSYKLHEGIPQDRTNPSIANITNEVLMEKRSTAQPISDERSRELPRRPLRRQ